MADDRPAQYAGETVKKVNTKQVEGAYKLVNHGKDISADLKHSVNIQLERNGNITGDAEGTWLMSGSNDITLTIDGQTYKGIVLRQWDSSAKQYVMTFSALSNQGISVWGTETPIYKDQQLVQAVKRDLELGDISAVQANLTLPTSGKQEAAIAWSSSHPHIVDAEGKVNRPAFGEGDAQVTLTATIKKGRAKVTKTFQVVVKEQHNSVNGRIAHFNFDNDLTDLMGNFSSGSVVGPTINAAGGHVAFDSGVKGQAAVFDGASGVRLPNGLISGDQYSVSLWVNPQQLTALSPVFFGARDQENWISLLPMGHEWVEHDTMLWSGTAWYDAGTRLKIEAGQWTHLAFAVDQGTISVYVNGDVKYTGTNFPDVFTTANGTFSLGVNWWDTPFQGKIDELQIYAEALTAERVAELATP